MDQLSDILSSFFVNPNNKKKSSREKKKSRTEIATQTEIDTITVKDIAISVINKMNLHDTNLIFGETDYGWKGDVPVILLSNNKIKVLPELNLGALRELNLQLSDERAKIRQAIVENDKLRKMLEFKKEHDKELITSDIIGKTTTEVRNFATINRGENEGIQVGMPVVTDAGLVGLIVGTSANFSVVRFS